MYIVYQRISPSGKSYIGYTKLGLMERWKQCVMDSRRGRKFPLYHAIRKYGPDTWTHVVLFETDDKQLALDAECVYISLLGQYNLAAGGTGGHIHDQTGNTWTVSEQGRRNMREARLRDKDKLKEQRALHQWKTEGGNNYQSVFYIHTPWGTFETWRDATNKAKQLRALGNKAVVSDEASLKRYCYDDITLSVSGRRTFVEWRGRSTRELGFWIEDKNED